MKSKCDNCGWIGEPTFLLHEVSNLLQRVEPGGIVPSGECPQCDCLCYPVKDRPLCDQDGQPTLELLRKLLGHDEPPISIDDAISLEMQMFKQLSMSSARLAKLDALIDEGDTLTIEVEDGGVMISLNGKMIHEPAESLDAAIDAAEFPVVPPAS